MSNAVNTHFLDSILGFVLSGPIKVQLMADTYTFSSAHDAFDDVSAHAVGTATAITGLSSTGGEVFGDDTVIASVAGGDTVESLWIFSDSGDPSTSALMAYIDTKEDTTPISITTNGGDISIGWAGGRLFKI